MFMPKEKSDSIKPIILKNSELTGPKTMSVHAVKQRHRVASLTLESSDKKGIFKIAGIYSFGSLPRRLSLDSKLQQVSHLQLLAMIDDNLLIQEIKAHLIFSEVETKRQRSRSVQDLVKTFESSRCSGFANLGDKSSLRFRLGQFTLNELWEELRERGEVNRSLDSLERRISHWDALRGILISKHCKPSKHSIGKMLLSDLSERDESVDSFETNINSLKGRDVENKLSSEIKFNTTMLIGASRLQDSADNGLKKSAKNETLAQATMLTESWLPDNGKANSDDEKLTGVLDEVHVLNQRLLKVRNDVEELCTRATKVRCELAKMRQLRSIEKNYRS